MNNIKWQDAINSKPTKPESDSIFSKCVIVWVIDSKGNGAQFGVYFYDTDQWSVNAKFGNWNISHFAEINEPINY